LTLYRRSEILTTYNVTNISIRKVAGIMQVKDFMIKDVISVGPDASIKDIIKVFVEKKIGGLPINSEDGKLLGMVTDGDILRAVKPIDDHVIDFFMYMTHIAGQDVLTRLKEMASVKCLKIATTKGIVTVSPEDNMNKVVSLLSKHHFKKLPVIDRDNNVLGVISRGDVVRLIQAKILEELGS